MPAESNTLLSVFYLYLPLKSFVQHHVVTNYCSNHIILHIHNMNMNILCQSLRAQLQSSDYIDKILDLVI